MGTPEDDKDDQFEDVTDHKESEADQTFESRELDYHGNYFDSYDTFCSDSVVRSSYGGIEENNTGRVSPTPASLSQLDTEYLVSAIWSSDLTTDLSTDLPISEVHFGDLDTVVSSSDDDVIVCSDDDVIVCSEYDDVTYASPIISSRTDRDVCRVTPHDLRTGHAPSGLHTNHNGGVTPATPDYQVSELNTDITLTCYYT